MSARLREQLLETARAMNDCGLNEGTAGNLSVRCGSGMLITPSAMPYTEITAGDIVSMDLDGTARGRLRPSSEWRFHAAIYRHDRAAGSVLHAHPPFCTALACLGRGLPAFHYMVAAAGGENIRCASYATFGTEELTASVLEALEGRKACLMAHHGLTCFERNLDRVLALARLIEHLAGVYCRALAISEPKTLDAAEMARVLEKLADYGL